MTVQFREKARIAYDTMPPDMQQGVTRVIALLNINELSAVQYAKLRVSDADIPSADIPSADIYVARIGTSGRLLFQRNKDGFLIIDILDRSKEEDPYNAYSTGTSV